MQDHNGDASCKGNVVHGRRASGGRARPDGVASPGRPASSSDLRAAAARGRAPQPWRHPRARFARCVNAGVAAGWCAGARVASWRRASTTGNVRRRWRRRGRGGRQAAGGGSGWWIRPRCREVDHDVPTATISGAGRVAGSELSCYPHDGRPSVLGWLRRAVLSIVTASPVERERSWHRSRSHCVPGPRASTVRRLAAYACHFSTGANALIPALSRKPAEASAVR